MSNLLLTNLKRIHLSQAFWSSLMNSLALILAAAEPQLIAEHPTLAACCLLGANVLFEIQRLLTGKPPELPKGSKP